MVHEAVNGWGRWGHAWQFAMPRLGLSAMIELAIALCNVQAQLALIEMHAQSAVLSVVGCACQVNLLTYRD